MPRTPRQSSTLDLYHICDRGVDKRIIFNDDNDRLRFVEFLQRTFDKADGDLLAWCLMTNHIHLVVQMEKDEMSQSMQALIGNYARYYNSEHGRTGYLLESRYKSQPIDTERYLLAAIRYVHQNPVKANMVPTCAYPWSSYLEYIGKPKLTATGIILGALGGKEGFLSLHEQTEDDPRLIDVDNGWHMNEQEAWDVACRVIGTANARTLDSMRGERRDEQIRRLLAARIPGIQIAKIAHLSESTVSRIKNKLTASTQM